LRELDIDAWREYFAVLKHDLANSEGRISFISDIWSDDNTRPYLAITTHWIASGDGPKSLRMKAGLITFHHLPGSHTGAYLASTILRLLDCAGVTKQVCF
ncbi:hypothetical protein PAXINDRAFT_71397, partial [Paxillus involutus ATCC 200175]